MELESPDKSIRILAVLKVLGHRLSLQLLMEQVTSVLVQEHDLQVLRLCILTHCLKEGHRFILRLALDLLEIVMQVDFLLEN